jgi:hypothetical protein
MLTMIDEKAVQLEKHALENDCELKVVDMVRIFNDVPVYLVEMEGFVFAGYVPVVDVYMVGKDFFTFFNEEEQQAVLYHEEGHRVHGDVDTTEYEDYLADEIAADAYAVSKGYGHVMVDILTKSFEYQASMVDEVPPYVQDLLDARVAAMLKGGE